MYRIQKSLNANSNRFSIEILNSNFDEKNSTFFSFYARNFVSLSTISLAMGIQKDREEKKKKLCYGRAK